MTIRATTSDRDKRDRKLRADKKRLSITTAGTNGVSLANKAEKKEKKVKKEKNPEKPPISIVKLRTIYGILYEETFPEEEDIEKERSLLIKAIKKALK